jgi:hypothetical protein
MLIQELNLSMHTHIIFFSLYKIAHVYFPLRIIIMLQFQSLQ